MKISIVIVNWNAGLQLKNCVSSIKDYHSGLVSSVVIVDNASSDFSLVKIDELGHLPFELKIIRNEFNQGFGFACNQGAVVLDGEYILFLNPDANLFENSLVESIKCLENKKYKDVGIVGVQLIDEQNNVARSCTRFPSIIGLILHAIGLDRIIPRLGHFMAEWSHNTTQEVDHVIGAFYLVRRKVYDLLNGFDNQFFVYLEDLDFSYRAQQAGWRIMYLADVQAFHAGGGTSDQVKARRLFYSLRSRLIYSFKHFSFVGAVFVLLSTLFLEPISRSALAIARRSWTSFKETWQGYGMLWRWLPQWWFKGVTR